MVSSEPYKGDTGDPSTDNDAQRILADARDSVADAREALADAREDAAQVADDARDQRDILADERDRRSDKREAYSAIADHDRTSRDWIADERDRFADERESMGPRVPERQRAGASGGPGVTPVDDDAAAAWRRDLDNLVAEAAHRDFLANRRDSAANRRDMKASLDAFLSDDQDDAGLEQRRMARIDRTASRLDRTSSATDRVTLSTAIGEVELPAAIPTARSETTPLTECTVEEVSTYSAVLHGQSVDETRDAIDSVELDSAVTPRVKELLDASMNHHDTAADFAWYVDEWRRTGSRPQPAGDDEHNRRR